MKKTLSVLMFILVALSASAQKRSFAIVTDSKSYATCKDEINDYAESVSNDGLDAFVLAASWQSPDEIRDTLKFYYRSKNLEGAVFVGDIPIAMIRGAQHLTSAFKMDEDTFDWRDSSVPSDRFYDDFDLVFDAEKDTTESASNDNLLHYYRLAARSLQYINCDIYTARIKPSSDRQDKYVELAKYLRKVVAAKKEMANNDLDKVASYTGHGSFSNSLIAWKDESITLGEQIPLTGTNTGEQKFFIYAMYPFVKDMLLEEIQKKDLDLMLFHEHGTPDRQYIAGFPESEDVESYYTNAKRQARDVVRTQIRYGRTYDEAVKYVNDKYGIDTTWYGNALSKTMATADSLYDLKTGIILDDIAANAPNVKMSIFDACYNGDFRESDCVAARYIFSDGDALIGIGNSVNVLQDKSSSDLMGMLAAGYRVGEWMQMTNILESHIHGDPTLHFKSSYSNGVKPDIHNNNCAYWTKYLNAKYPCDIQGIALHKLHNLGYKGMPELLLKTFEKSPYYMLRLQCMHLLAHYKGDEYAKLLSLAIDDPYEFIRRKAAFYMGKNGLPSFAEALCDMYLKEYNSLRVAFNVGFSAGHFDTGVFSGAMEKAIAEADFIYDKETFKANADKYTRGSISMMESTRKAIADKEGKARSRSIYISGMRNNPYPHLLGDVLDAIQDEGQDLSIRIQLAEVAGWYVRAANREEITKVLGEYIQKPGVPEELKSECLKTINRISDYLR